MTNIRRYDPVGRPVFITAICYKRIPYLKTDEQKELLLSIMREVKESMSFSMKAYVILDDHFHWIMTPCSYNFSKIMQSIKLRFVHRFKKSAAEENNLILWQRRFWDHVIRDNEDLRIHMDYIHYNPIKHGYVHNLADYRWSSFNDHVILGNYSADWGTTVIPAKFDEMSME